MIVLGTVAPQGSAGGGAYEPGGSLYNPNRERYNADGSVYQGHQSRSGWVDSAGLLHPGQQGPRLDGGAFVPAPGAGGVGDLTCLLAPETCKETPPVTPPVTPPATAPSTSTWLWAGAAVVALGGTVAFVLMRRKRRRG